MLVAVEVQLGGQQLVAGSRDLQVKVRRAPGVSSRTSNELAAGFVSGHLAGRRLDHVQRKVALGVGRFPSGSPGANWERSDSDGVQPRLPSMYSSMPGPRSAAYLGLAEQSGAARKPAMPQ